MIASFLSGVICANPKHRKKVLGFKPLLYKFNLRAFILDLMLVDKAKEGNGLCEYFFSFAFLSPKAIQERRETGEGVGPFGFLRWPFASPGGVLREVFLSFFLSLISVGIILMFYSFSLGLKYFLIGLCLMWAGLKGVFMVKNTIES